MFFCKEEKREVTQVNDDNENRRYLKVYLRHEIMDSISPVSNHPSFTSLF